MKQLNLKPKRLEMEMELLHRNVQFHLLLASECDNHYLGGRVRKVYYLKSGFGKLLLSFFFP
jgi:hypothetical protein